MSPNYGLSIPPFCILNIPSEDVIAGPAATTAGKKATQDFVAPNRVSWRAALFFVALTATAVVSPMFFLGNASGHDIQFHLSSWMEVAGQWRHGNLYPRWAEWADWGFGEPRFIFYPPVSWMLGAALGLMLPWNMVPGAVIWIALVIAGMSMWTLAREWLSGGAAIAASVFFAADPYHLVTLYYRSDYAELLGASLLPLLIWTAMHLSRGERKYAFWFAAVFALVWLCNAPVGVIATYALAVVLAIECVLHHSARPLVSGGLAMLFGFLLAGFYLVPAAYEQRWVQIASAVSGSLAPDRNFLFARNNELGFLEFNAQVSRVALGMMMVSVIAATWIARRRSLRDAWLILSVLGALSVVLLFQPSLVLWHLLPKLWFIQFPWRWLDVLALHLAFFVAAIAGGFRSRAWFWTVVLVASGAITATAALIINDTWWDSKDAAYIQRGIEARHGYDPADEYAPLGTSPWDLPGEPMTDDKDAPPPPETPRVEAIDSNSGKLAPVNGAKVGLTFRDWSVERRIFTVSTDSPTLLGLRLLNYPAWRVTIDGHAVQPESQPVTGQMVLAVPAGTHNIVVRFRRTWDRILGDIISLLAAGVFGFLYFRLPSRPS